MPKNNENDIKFIKQPNILSKSTMVKIFHLHIVSINKSQTPYFVPSWLAGFYKSIPMKIFPQSNYFYELSYDCSPISFFKNPL